MPKTATSDIASKVVGQEVRHVRTALGLSQAGVARLLDVTPGYIASIEAGRYNLTIGQLMNIASALQVELDIKLNIPEDDEPLTIVPRAHDSEEHGEASLAELFAARAEGMTPADFYLAFKSGQLEDTTENMTMLVQAIALLGHAPSALHQTTSDATLGDRRLVEAR